MSRQDSIKAAASRKESVKTERCLGKSVGEKKVSKEENVKAAECQSRSVSGKGSV